MNADITLRLFKRRISIGILLVSALFLALYIERFRIQGYARSVIGVIDPTIPQIHTVAVARNNIQYCGGTNAAQKLDIYTPRHDTQAVRPVVLYIHGGGWHNGNKQNPIVYNYGPAAINAGFTFVSMNYNLAPKSHYPTQPNDIACALKFLTLNAAKYHVDTQRTVLMGDSAGGSLAAYTGLRPVSHGRIIGVIDLYGDTDLVAQMDRKVRPNPYVHGYLGARSDKLAKAASPLTYVHPGAPPFLIIHGVKDRTVPIEQSEHLANALQAVHVPVQLIEVQHAGHAFGIRSGSHPTIRELDISIENFLSPL